MKEMITSSSGEDHTSHNPKPFLKWAGGKRALLPQLLKLVPSSYNKYHEPFLGGGSVFFALRPKQAYLADINTELINTYIVVRDEPAELVNLLTHFRHNKAEYYRVRALEEKTSLNRAARFIYLNRSCWNGLYRVNKLGQFNVPFGRYTKPLICDPQNLLVASKALKQTVISNSTFADTLKRPRKNDFVYCDPPYTVAHDKNGFLGYNEKIFSWEDQLQLKQLIDELTDSGSFVMVSNACHESIKQLYKDYEQIVVKRNSTIAGKTSARSSVNELVILNYRPITGGMIW